jgi:hypothetical protein
MAVRLLQYIQWFDWFAMRIEMEKGNREQSTSNIEKNFLTAFAGYSWYDKWIAFDAKYKESDSIILLSGIIAVI